MGIIRWITQNTPPSSGDEDGDGRPKAFLLVISRTHYKTMEAVARVLHDSGSIVPQMVYYPARVYDENYLGCAETPYAARVFDGRRFVPPLTRGEAVTMTSPLAAPGGMGVLRVIFGGPLARKALRLGAHLRQRGWFRFAAPDTDVQDARAHFLMFLNEVTWRFLVCRHRDEAAPRDAKTLLRLWRIALDEHGVAKDDTWCENVIGLQYEQMVAYAAATDLLSASDNSIFVFPEENILYNGHVFVRACKDKGIQSAVVPFTICDQNEIVGSFYHYVSAHADQGANAFFADVFPRWARRFRDRRLVMPAPYVLCCLQLGMRFSDPWLINSGPAEVITADSKVMLDYFLRAGIHPAKIQLTGSLVDDIIFAQVSQRAERRAALLDRHRVMAPRRLVLIAAPPDMFARDHTNWEFHTHADLLRFMVSAAVAACGPEDGVIVNLHPNTPHGSVLWIGECGSVLVSEPIETLIPLADVFVAVASATIRFAIGASIPTVNYDVFQFDYDDYRRFDGVVAVRNRHEYQLVLGRLLHDDAYYRSVKASQATTAAQAYRIDGHAGRRMLHLFSKMLTRNA